jgi:hypothetical protein
MHPIYILTYARPKQLTWENLPNELKARVVFVVHPNEAERFRGTGAAVLECSVQGLGAGKVRDFILGYSVARGDSCTIMLDDDLAFKAINKDKKFAQASDLQIIAAFAKLELKCHESEVLFSGFGTTFFNDGSIEWNDCGSVVGSFFIDTRAAARANLSFSGVPTAEDVYFTLSGYKAGFKNSVYQLVCAVATPSGVGGEAGAGNRGARHEEALKILCEEFAPYVKARENKNKNHLTVIQTPWDMTIQWKRAYAKYSQK